MFRSLPLAEQLNPTPTLSLLLRGRGPFARALRDSARSRELLHVSSTHGTSGTSANARLRPADQMPLMRKQNSLQMEWCLECHRHPERYVRPREDVFNMRYVPPANQIEVGRKLVADYRIRRMTDCNACHR